MGKVFKVLGVIFLLLIVGVAGLLFWAHRAGDKEMDRFFGAVETGDPQKVIDLLHPSVRSEVDPPILKLWMDAVNTNLGKFEGLSAGSFGTETKSTSDGQVTETHGTAQFEKGEAEVNLTILDDQIVSFKVNSEQVDGKWFGKPESDFYKRQSETFIRNMMSGNVEQATGIMHPNLLEQLDVEKTKAGVKGLSEQLGPLKSIEFTDEKFYEDEHGYYLLLAMKCTYENQTVPAYTRFVFQGGLRGDLLGYHLVKEPE